MKLRSLQLALVLGLLAALLLMASGLAAQDTGGFALTATALAGNVGATATITPLPSLTPMGTPPPTTEATTAPTATVVPAASSTPLPSLTPVGAVPPGELAGTPSGEVQLEATAQDAEATAEAQGLAPVAFEVPYVTPEQEAPPPPSSAAGMGTLILLFGLGGATVIGLLMLARDRYRDHREE